MKIRALTFMPGTIGGLPAGENFEAGREYPVTDTLGRTMVREGWAVEVKEDVAAGLAPAVDAGVAATPVEPAEDAPTSPRRRGAADR